MASINTTTGTTPTTHLGQLPNPNYGFYGGSYVNAEANKIKKYIATSKTKIKFIETVEGSIFKISDFNMAYSKLPDTTEGMVLKLKGEINSSIHLILQHEDDSLHLVDLTSNFYQTQIHKAEVTVEYVNISLYSPSVIAYNPDDVKYVILNSIY